jgi:hypothetical protein
MIYLESYCSWAWTPEHVAAIEAAEKQQQTGLILPPQSKPFEGNAHLVHFSTLRPEGQHSWIWLFDNACDAVSVKITPSMLPDDDPVGDLISATLPDENIHGKTNYLQSVPRSWLKSLDFDALDIHEVWFGFNWKIFCQDRSLRAAIPEILSAEEFTTALRR